MARGKKALPDKTLAVGVVRVSTQGQDVGAEGQERIVREWAARNGVRLEDVFEDRMSGKKKLENRAALLAAFDRCRELRAGMLVATNWDRYSRDKHFFTDLERMATAEGVTLVTVEGGLNEAPVLRDIKQALASEERRAIVERNLRRVRTCKDRGQVHGGKPPYGWRLKPGGRVGTYGRVVELEEDEGEQKMLAEMLTLRESGLTILAVVEELNAQGFCRRDGGKWSRDMVRKILRRLQEKQDDVST